MPANYASMKPADQGDAQRAAYQHDFAMVLVDGSSATGVMPYALDWKGKVSYVTRVGYAGDILDGQIVQKSGGAVFFADAIPMLPKSYPNIVVQWAPITDLTEGTSGGAWIANFSTSEGANKNILVAVTSFQFTGLSRRRGRGLSDVGGIQPAAGLRVERLQMSPGAPSPRHRSDAATGRLTCRAYEVSMAVAEQGLTRARCHGEVAKSPHINRVYCCRTRLGRSTLPGGIRLAGCAA